MERRHPGDMAVRPLAAGVALLLVALSVACRGRQAPVLEPISEDSERRHVDSTRGEVQVPSAGPRGDVPRPPVDGAAVEPTRDLPGLLPELLRYCSSRLGWGDLGAEIHDNDALAKEQATFLDRDFGDRSLRRRTGAAFVNVLRPAGGRQRHLGIVELRFRRCADLQGAVRAIRRLNRDSFKVAAPSRFRVFERDLSLVVLFSETASDESMARLLESAAREAPGAPGCGVGGRPRRR